MDDTGASHAMPASAAASSGDAPMRRATGTSLPEEQIEATIAMEPGAASGRLQSELQRLHGLSVARQPLRTYLERRCDPPADSTDIIARRRTAINDGEQWLQAREQRVLTIIGQLGLCGRRTLQRTISDQCGVSPSRQLPVATVPYN